MDAFVCLPRINTEQKRLGRKEFISLAFWSASVYMAVLGGFRGDRGSLGLEDQEILGSDLGSDQ